MAELTPEERSTITRYLARQPRGRLDYVSSYAVYFVPSILFALYGVWKNDLIAVTFAYAVLLIAVAYIIGYQTRSSGLFYSAIKKLADNASESAAAPVSDGDS